MSAFIVIFLYSSFTFAQSHRQITNSVGMEFVSIPSGKFMMGSVDVTKETKESPKNETLHEVTISKGFYIQITEVTQAQWLKVMGSNPCKVKGANLAVSNITWNDVQEFIIRLNRLENTNKYRLPTEAEWEYACRAGTTAQWSFGDDSSQLNKYAWCKKDMILGMELFPVNYKTPNPWGLFEMHGNVNEWCQDYYLQNLPSYPVTDPKGPDSGSKRVVRGGVYWDEPVNTRSSVRNSFYPDIRNANLGFRLVKDL